MVKRVEIGLTQQALWQDDALRARCWVRIDRQISTCCSLKGGLGAEGWYKVEWEGVGRMEGAQLNNAFCDSCSCGLKFRVPHFASRVVEEQNSGALCSSQVLSTTKYTIQHTQNKETRTGRELNRPQTGTSSLRVEMELSH